MFFLLGAAAAIGGFAIEFSAGILVLILSAAFGVLFWGFIRYRYDKLDRLSEAVRNILKNCMESVGDNGRIEIVCEDNPLYTKISIHDSGPGIPAEDLPFLFERFYRGKNSDASGYGIGLALCRTIIMRQDGTISAKNHPEGGAVFTIRFLHCPTVKISE